MYHLFIVLVFMHGGFSDPETKFVQKEFSTYEGCHKYAKRVITSAASKGAKQNSYDCIYIEE